MVALPVAGLAPYTGAMRIANPMYDAAFKYLMDDDASARLLVGAVLSCSRYRRSVPFAPRRPQRRASRRPPNCSPYAEWTSQLPSVPPPATACACWSRCRRHASPTRSCASASTWAGIRRPEQLRRGTRRPAPPSPAPGDLHPRRVPAAHHRHGAARGARVPGRRDRPAARGARGVRGGAEPRLLGGAGAVAGVAAELRPGAPAERVRPAAAGGRGARRAGDRRA